MDGRHLDKMWVAVYENCLVRGGVTMSRVTVKVSTAAVAAVVVGCVAGFAVGSIAGVLARPAARAAVEALLEAATEAPGGGAEELLARFTAEDALGSIAVISTGLAVGVIAGVATGIAVYRRGR